MRRVREEQLWGKMKLKKNLLQQRIETLKELSTEELKKKEYDRTINDFLRERGLDIKIGSAGLKSAGLRTEIRELLIGVGVLSIRGTKLGDVLKMIAKRKIPTEKASRQNFLRLISMLDSAGIVKKKIIYKGKSGSINFDIIDRERLKKSAEEGRIVWKGEK